MSISSISKKYYNAADKTYKVAQKAADAIAGWGVQKAQTMKGKSKRRDMVDAAVARAVDKRYGPSGGLAIDQGGIDLRREIGKKIVKGISKKNKDLYFKY
jgi:hypothetical protein